jgi:general secretion pathway protein G
VLAAMTVPLAEVAAKRSREQELRVALRQIREAIDAYKQLVDDGRVVRAADETGYPKTLEVLASGIEDAKDPKKAKIYLLRQLPRDPMSTNPAQSPGATWGKRSYASPPDDPKPGSDIFDVYSLNTGVGLNGIKYREW